MVFSFWKSVRLSKLLRQRFGISSGRENTVRTEGLVLAASFLGEHDMIRIIYNLLWPIGLLFFFAGLLAEDVPSWRLPRKIWAARRNLRGRCTHALGEAKIHMAACQ